MATRLTWGLGAVLVAAAVMSCSGGDAELVDGTFTP